MRLATIRTAAGHRAVRVDDGARGGDGRRGRPRAAHPPRLAGAGRGGRRAVARARHRRLRAARAGPREDHLRRAELPRPRRWRWATSCPSTPRSSPSSRPRWSARTTTSCCPAVSDKVDWEAELTVVIGTPGAARRRGRGGGGDRGLHGDERRERARLPEPHQAVPAGQDVRALHAAGPAPGHPGRAARGRLGHRHHARRRDRAELRRPTSSCSGRSSSSCTCRRSSR